MRTYLILKERAQRFNNDPEIQSLLAQATTPSGPAPDYASGYTRERGRAIMEETLTVGISEQERSLPTRGWTS